METTKEVIDRLLVDVFNNILTIEEAALRTGPFSDITIAEAHTIEAVGLHSKKTMSEIAKKLNITVGTLTVAVGNLVKKGYVERFKSIGDRRVVLVGLTKKGKLMYRIHKRFHSQMINEATEGLSKEESEILASALKKIHNYLAKRL